VKRHSLPDDGERVRNKIYSAKSLDLPEECSRSLMLPAYFLKAQNAFMLQREGKLSHEAGDCNRREKAKFKIKNVKCKIKKA
jgi:hypothetical protein